MSAMPLDYDYYFMDRKFSNSLLTAIKTNYHWYWADLKNALVKCGYKMEDWASHDFRRNSATDVWNMSKDPLTVSRYLRHKQFETTIRYLNNAGLQNRDMSQKLEKLYNNQ
jgi:hypothetical protein